MLGHSHTHELVGSQAQDVEHGRVDALQRAVRAGGDHRIVAPLEPQGPVGQGGGEAGVAPIQVGGLQQLGQQEVGEGVIAANAGEHLQGHLTRRVRSASR